MRRRLFTISAMRFGEMPMAFASWFCDRPYSVRNSSFNISPGVTGSNSARATRLSLVTVDDRNLFGVAVGPPKDRTPLIVDTDRMGRLQVTLQFLKAI